MDEKAQRHSIDIRDDGVYLCVYPSFDEAEQTGLETVLVDLASARIFGYDRLLVEEAVRSMNGSPVKIAEAQPVAAFADVSVVVSRDRMEAFLQIDATPQTRMPDLESIREKVLNAGVVFGISSDSIEKAIKQPNCRIVCAKGRLPENGCDAKIEYLFDLEQRGKPAEMPDGGVDFKNLGLCLNVEKGQVLAIKIPSTAGTPGMDVCGNFVPPKQGRDIAITPGANVHVVDEDKLVASVSGNLTLSGSRISVSPILQIKGDVDLATGNIDFAGDVVIYGSVQEGFSVKAGGNVDIAGMVSGGLVQGDNITVRQGIIGLNKGVLHATGSVVAKFVENAKITAGQDILISDVVLHSHLSAGKKICVVGRRGQIVGGSASAADEIVIKSAGSSSTTPTDLQVGVNPKLREEYFALRKELKLGENSLDQIQKGLFTLRSMDQNSLSPDKKELFLKLTRAQFTTLGHVNSMRQRMNELEAAYEDLKDGQVKISDIVFPGVKIMIGSLVKPVQEIFRYVIFYAEAGEIKVRPFK